MRKFLIPALSMFIALGSQSALADSAQVDFARAYKAYQAAVEDSDQELAATQAERAFNIGALAYGDTHENVARLSYNWGKALLEIDDPRAAKILEDSLQRYRKALGENSLELIDPLMALGTSLAVPDGDQQSREYFEQALALVTKHRGASSTLYAELSSEVGVSLLQRAKSQRSQYYLRNAYRLFKDNGEESSLAFAATALHLGKFYLLKGIPDSAENYLNEALVVFQENLPADDPMMLSTRGHLVAALEKAGKSDEATEHCHAVASAAPWSPGEDPRALFEVKPDYRRYRSHSREESEALVVFTIDASGFVRNPRLAATMGDPDFALAAIEAIKQWRFVPHTRKGEPVATDNVEWVFNAEA